MKKLTLVLSAGFSFAIAHAQLAFGIKGGANISNVGGSDAGGTSSLVGFNAGAYLNIPILVQHLSLEPELVYSAQGFKETSGGITTTQHINYLNIPILFKYSFGGVFVETGPQAGILMSAKAKALGETADDKNGFFGADWAWVFGAQVKIPMTPITVDARYNFGMSNIINENENNGNTLNGCFQIGVMVSLFTAPIK
jgi:hypothetical protein